MILPNLLSILRSQESFYEFDCHMLPKGIIIKDITTLSTFLSPQIIIEHGSYVTKKRYSPDGRSDIDLIIATLKKSFWPTDYLYDNIKYKFQKYFPDIKFDITLVSPTELIFNIQEDTSLGKSLIQGFTILYPEKVDATR
jgi:hypothetical protein